MFESSAGPHIGYSVAFSYAFSVGFLLWLPVMAFWCGPLVCSSVMVFCYGLLVWPSVMAFWLKGVCVRRDPPSQVWWTSGQYASYWNAFLSTLCLCLLFSLLMDFWDVCLSPCRKFGKFELFRDQTVLTPIIF